MNKWIEVLSNQNSTRSQIIWTGICHGGIHDDHDIEIRIWFDSAGAHQVLDCAQCKMRVHQTLERKRYTIPTINSLGDASLVGIPIFLTFNP